MGSIHHIVVSVAALLWAVFGVTLSSTLSGNCYCLDSTTVYRIQNVGTQFYVDWLGDNRDMENKNLDSSPTNKQTFMFEKVSSQAYKIQRATDPGKYWEVKGGDLAEGTFLTSNPPTGDDDIQIFLISEGPDGNACYIRNEYTRKFVDGSYGQDGGVIQKFYSVTDHEKQLWKIMPTGICSNFVPGQSYRIVSKANNTLHLSWETKDGTVAAWISKNRAEDYNAGNTQMFTVEDIGGGLYKIRQDHSASARVLHVYQGKTAEGTKVGTWNIQIWPRQKWRIQDAGDGYCYIMPNHTTNRYLDGRTGQDGLLAIWAGNSGDYQKWKFAAARCGTPVECDVCLDRPETTTNSYVEGSCSNLSPGKSYRIVSGADQGLCMEYNPDNKGTYLKPRHAYTLCNQVFNLVEAGSSYDIQSAFGPYIFSGNGGPADLDSTTTPFSKTKYNVIPAGSNTCRLQNNHFQLHYMDSIKGLDERIMDNNLTSATSQLWTFVPIQDNATCSMETTTQFQTTPASTGSCSNFCPTKTYRIVSVEDTSLCMEWNSNDRGIHLKPRDTDPNSNQVFKVSPKGSLFEFITLSGNYIFRGNEVHGDLGSRTTSNSKTSYHIILASANTCLIQNEHHQHQHLDSINGTDKIITTNDRTNEISQQWTFVPVQAGPDCPDPETTQLQISSSTHQAEACHRFEGNRSKRVSDNAILSQTDDNTREECASSCASFYGCNSFSIFNNSSGGCVLSRGSLNDTTQFVCDDSSDAYQLF